MQHDRSRAIYGRSLSVFPGGVNSPVRATRPYPLIIDRGENGHVIDVDGNRYIDYIMGYGPLLHGHSLPEAVQKAISERVAAGPMFGAPTESELALGEFIREHVESVEMLRFVNSGTEATSTALRLARGVTGRDRVVMVDGGYHGGLEATLATSEGTPSSLGIPAAVTKDTITIPFNDLDAAERVFQSQGDEIAAVLVEPMLGNTGVVHPIEGYLDYLRQLTTETGALLIFDEVMTGFRIGGLACAQGAFGVQPDLTTFAKVIGGGFPVGAVGGRRRIMEHLTPAGEVFHASTYAGHPVGMVAGVETLRYAADNESYAYLADLGDQLRRGLGEILEDVAPAYTVVGRDSMWKVVFSNAPAKKPDAGCAAGCRQRPACPRHGQCPTTAADVKAAEGERWERLFWGAMREEGVLLTANQDESQFLCSGHTQADIETTLEAYKTVLPAIV